MEKKYNLSEFGIEAVIGKFAGQADGAVWLQQGGTVVLATVVTEQAKDFPGYFPLMVDYREQLASVGRIPGGYMKREGKPSDEEVLVGRLIDRAIRPLFPVNYFDKVQVSVTVYSVDKEHMPHPLALLATSLALTISPIPFMGPVGICDVARIGGELVFNPTYAQSHESDIELIVVGNDSGINMVEGSAQELLEKDFVDALFKAHEFVKRQIVGNKRFSAIKQR